MSLLGGFPRAGAQKKRSPSLGGASGACPAEMPPAANRHYLQLVGTYLVRMVPAAPTGRDCAVAVVFCDDAHAQSMLPARVFGNAVLFTDGVSVRVLAAPNCVI